MGVSSRDRVEDLDRKKGRVSSEAGKNGHDCFSDSAKGVIENVLVMELNSIQRLNCRYSC
jgi:hypothetical protein